MAEKTKGTKEKGTRPVRRRVLSIAVQAAVLVAVVVAISAWQARGLLPRAAAAPVFSLPALSGGEVELGGARGRPALVYFFAPWCGVCRHASSNVAALRRSRAPDRLDVLAVALAWESRGSVEAFARDHGLEVPVLLGDDRVLAAYRVEAFPTFYVLDRDGAVRSRAVGYTTWLGLWARSL